MREITYGLLKRRIKEGKLELTSDINKHEKVWLRRFGSKREEIVQVTGNPEDFFTIGKKLGAKS